MKYTVHAQLKWESVGPHNIHKNRGELASRGRVYCARVASLIENINCLAGYW